MITQDEFVQLLEKYSGVMEVSTSTTLKMNKGGRGGVEDLIATFSFRDGTVDTKITWADDGQDSDINKAYRQGLGVSRKNQAVLKQTKKTPTPRAKTQPEGVTQLPGQLSLEDLPEIAEPLPFV